MLEVIDNIYRRHSPRLCQLAAFLLPLKLPLAYAALIPALIMFLLRLRERSFRNSLHPAMNIFLPLIFFIITAIVSAAFGINPLRSIERLLGLSFFACSILLFFDVTRQAGGMGLLASLFTGQSIAAVHSIMTGAFPELLPPMFPGQVTESGQLAITMTLASGVALYLGSEINGGNRPAFSAAKSADLILWGITNFFLLGILAFAPSFRLSATTMGMLLISTSVSMVLAVIMPLRVFAGPHARNQLHVLLHTVILPLFATALLVNLKRGPWAGVLVASLILLFLYGRKFLAPTILLALSLVSYIEPISRRLQDAPEHFFIAGGRAKIWEIGTDLATRYPLGIGFKNSNFLRNFSPEIPPQLVHFHSNLLNITAETGWLGLLIFLWWVYKLLGTAFTSPFASKKSILISSTGAALLAWQVAGIVEYNFGDSEVLLLAYLSAGLLAGLVCTTEDSWHVKNQGTQGA